MALKVLPAGIAADDKAFQRFMREAKTTAKLNHTNIVSVHGVGIEQNTPYYAMEFVEGETLAQVLAKVKEADETTETPFGKKGVLAFYSNLASAFADVADGLQHAHSKGVIHRDIKPSNLILDGDRPPAYSRLWSRATRRTGVADSLGGLRRHTALHEPGAGASQENPPSITAPMSTPSARRCTRPSLRDRRFAARTTPTRFRRSSIAILPHRDPS